MARPQVSLKMLLWLAVALGALCLAALPLWRHVEPGGRKWEVDANGNRMWITYYWRNGIGITVEFPASDKFLTRCPIRLETHVESLVE